MKNRFIYLLLVWFTFVACDKLSLDISAQEMSDSTGVDSTIIIDDNPAYSLFFSRDSLNARGMAGFLDSFSVIDYEGFSPGESFPTLNVFIGNSGMDESIKALEAINGSGYVIQCDGHNLVVAGTAETWTAMALYEMEEYLFENGFAVRGDTLTIPSCFSIVKDYDDPQLISRLIQKGLVFSLSPEFVLACPGLGNCTIGQGAVGDEAFFYVINKNGLDNQSVIFRYEIESLKWKGMSGIFNAGHSNDMAYNGDKDIIVVAHGQSQGRVLTLVRASDLSVLSDVTIEVGASSVSYNARKKQYAFSQGGTTLHFTDDNFKLIRSFSRDQVSGYTVQGMGSDDSYIYFPMSGSRNNLIVVYDWDGNYVTKLELPLSIESETLFYTAGEYYVNFNHSGSELYRINPVLYYTYEKGLTD